MFGYVYINNKELKKEDYERYRSLYCGLCYVLKTRHGELSRLTLNYDTVFLLMLLSSLYEPAEKSWDSNCITRPLSKHKFVTNEITYYIADMSIVLAYHKFKDDWADSKSLIGLFEKNILASKYEEIRLEYPRQCLAIEKAMDNLLLYEKNNSKNIDELLNANADILGEIFVYKEDYWAETLRVIGKALGRFIYFLDAYDDLKKDIKKKRFNPLISIYSNDNFENLCFDTLSILIAECTNTFELLPLEHDIDIMRNILYSGVWQKYYLNKAKDSRKDGNNE